MKGEVLVGDVEQALASGEADRVADDARLWWLVDVFRWCALVYAVLLFWFAQDEYRRPLGAWLVIGAMTAWTAALTWRRRSKPDAVPPSTGVQVADLAITSAAVLATMIVDEPARISAGAATLPSIWAASPVLAWAVWRGWRGGLAAAAVIAVVDVIEVSGRLSSSTINNLVILVLVGIVVGSAIEVFRTGRRELARAVAVDAAARERERIAADIHDSVLQVLSYVRRRGLELGGEAAEIAELAGEQEARLRALVAGGRAGVLPSGEQDLVFLLTPLSGAGITVSGTGVPVLLPARVAQAVAAAVAQALDNVRRHAGPGARAWVFVEEEDDEVRVSVRDDGVGMPAGRLGAAAQEGRLGIAASIRARIADVGGRASVVSAPGQGTEIELCVPRAALGQEDG